MTKALEIDTDFADAMVLSQTKVKVLDDGDVPSDRSERETGSLDESSESSWARVRASPSASPLKSSLANSKSSVSSDPAAHWEVDQKFNFLSNVMPKRSKI